jgi:hypothetical protein
MAGGLSPPSRDRVDLVIVAKKQQYPTLEIMVFLGTW